MPCMKDKKGVPHMMKCMDVPFDNIKMCMTILHAIPYGISTAYWARRGARHFPMYTKTLIKDLFLIKP